MNTPTHSVFLVVHPERAVAAAAAASVLAWCEQHGWGVNMTASDAERLDYPDLGVSTGTVDEVVARATVVVSVGGDGTMLFASRLTADHRVPVLGINTGRLGYLTEVEPDQIDSALDDVAAGRYEIEDRMRIELRVERADGTIEGPWSALNEGVVEKLSQGHTVHLAVDFHGNRFNTYSTDALIVATPTGSTAYSMSARGPIVEPTHRAILFTPVSPHTLFDRSLVLDPTTEVRITVDGDRQAILSVDGWARTQLGEGDSIVACTSSQSTHLISFGARTFHQVLTSKFGLVKER